MVTTRAFVTGLLTPPKTPVLNDVVVVKTTSPLATDYIPQGLQDAPADGKTYGRQNSVWHDVTGGAGLPEAPTDGFAYLRANNAWSAGGTLGGALVLARLPTGNYEAAPKLYVDNQTGLNVLKAGDTMTGPLVLPGNPSTALQAAPKQYVDGKVAKTGDTMTGVLTLSGDPVQPMDASTKQYADSKVSKAGDTMTGLLVLSGPPAVANGAATKAYVDSTSGNYVLKTGDTMSGGLSFGTNVAPGGVQDLSKHIMLHTAGYGFSITSNQLNYLMPGGAGSHRFYAGAATLILNMTATGAAFSQPVTVAADPTVALGVATKQYVDNKASTTTPLADGTAAIGVAVTYARADHVHPSDPTKLSDAPNDAFAYGRKAGAWTQVLPLTGGTLSGDVTTTARINVAANNTGLVGGADGVGIANDNLNLVSYSGIGIGTSAAAQTVPVGLSSAWINARSGNIVTVGNFISLVSADNTSSQIENVRFVKSAGDQYFGVDAAGYTPVVGAIAAGGSGWNVNDRAYDAYNNVYTVTAVSAGAVTGIRMDTSSAGPSRTNPAALAAAPGFSGTGLTVNITWTMPPTFHVRHANGVLSLEGSGGITLVNNTSASGTLTLSADPTAPMQASTKQYVDSKVGGASYLPLAGGTMTGTLVLAGPPVNPLDSVTKTYADSKVSLSGGSMSGLLVLSGDPAVANGAATKNYVDSKTAAGTYLPLAGGTMTGALTLAASAPAAAGDATPKSYVDTQVGTRVAKAGDTMTGLLVLSGNPTVANGAATKTYVDAADALAVLKTGSTMSGILTLSGNPVGVLDAVPKQYADTKVQIAGSTMTGPLVLNADPSAALGAATKQYVDTRVQRGGDTMTGILTLSGPPVGNLDAATKAYADSKVPLAGGTMTGLLVLSADPGAPLGAATKQYVDSKSGAGTYLPLAGGTMTGVLTLNGAPVGTNDAATKAYADTKVALAGGTMTGLLTLSGAPTTANQAATKAYVDAMVPLAGGTMTGLLVLSADPTASLGAATKQYVDNINIDCGTY